MSTMNGHAWPTVPLGKCCKIISGSTPRRDTPEYWEGNIAWATPKDLSDLDGIVLTETSDHITDIGLKSCSTHMLPQGAILFSSRAPIGLVAIAGKPMCTNQGFKNLVPLKDLDSRFLYWTMLKLAPQIQDLGNGATFKEISKAVIERVEIPLPKLEEQKRIAAILDKADAIRRQRQEVIIGTRELAVSAIEHELGLLSRDGMETASLESVCTKVTDGTHLTPTFRADGIPFIFVKNIVNQRIDFDTSKHIDNATYEQLTRTTKIEVGDVLYTTVGATYGQAALVETKERFAFQRHLAHLKPDKKVINSTYLAAVMNLPRTKWQADRWARGAAQPTLNLSELRQMVVPLPELEDQKRIASIQQKCNALLDKLEEALRHDDHLFNSLIQRAFKGEL